MNRQIKILGIAGSLRKDSFNQAALRAAQQLAPSNSTIEIFDLLREIPPFNQDLENQTPKSSTDT